MQDRTRSLKGMACNQAIRSVCGSALSFVTMIGGGTPVVGAGSAIGAMAIMISSTSAMADGQAGSEADGGESGGADDGGGGSCASGDCGTDNSQEGEANDTGDGEVCRDEDTCPCDSGNGGQATQSEPGGGGLHPVSWSTGEKWETEVDLRVKLKGADFRLTRQYSSDPLMFYDGSNIENGNLYDAAFPTTNYQGSGLTRLVSNPSIGEGWAFSNIRAITARVQWSCLQGPEPCGNGSAYPTTPFDAELKGWVLRPSRKPREYSVGISNAYSPGNQGVRIITPITSQGTLQTGTYCLECDPDTGSTRQGDPLFNGFISGTVRFEEPGRWYQDFDLTDGFGFISADFDEYGNRRDYIDTDGNGTPEIIYLNGDASNPANNWEAKVELDWANETSSTPVLSRAEVYRPGVTAPTQIVAYYHLDNDSGLKVKAWDTSTDTWVALSGLTPHADLGTDGDLVQVIRYTAIDPTASDVEYRPLITQYRYHNGLTGLGVGNDIRLRTVGNAHQLKMKFVPQQIEFLGQDSSTTGTAVADELQSGGTWVQGTLVGEAIDLLALADSATVTNTTHKVYEAAQKIVSYTNTGFSPVDFQFLQATNCGCGGSGSTSAAVRHYEMLDGWSISTGSAVYDGISMHIDEYDLANRTLTDDFPWLDTIPDPYRGFYYDMLLLGENNEDYPYVWMKAVIDHDTGDEWVTQKRYDYDKRTVVGIKHPSSFSNYTAATASPSAPSVTETTTGLHEGYNYTLKNENIDRTEVSKSGTPPNWTTVSDMNYRTDSDQREMLPTKRTEFRTGATGANLEEVTEYKYGFEDDSGSAKLDWRRISRERELTTENGPGGGDGWSHEWEFYDDQGQLIIHMDAGGMVTRYEYDDETGQLTKVTRNYDPTTFSSSPVQGLRVPDTDIATDDDITSDPFSGMSAPSDGTLITQYEYDELGRLTKVIRPGGVESWTMRELREDADRGGILYYAKISLPHNISATNPKTFDGPAQVRTYDSGGDVIRRQSYELSTTASYDPDAATPAYTLGTEIARSTVVHDLSGSSTDTNSWWDVASNQYYTTIVEHDSFGRVSRSEDANGTITERDYDVLDRVVEVRTGAYDPNTMMDELSTVAQYFYDGDPAATPASSVGNGNLTGIVMKDGVGDRVTRMYYDFRDRLIATVAPSSPMTITLYDNLDRPIEQGVYPEPTSAPSESTIQSFVSTSLAEDGTGLNLPSGEKRSWYSKTFYSQRGMAYRQQTAIDPSQASPSFLEWNGWYDEDGHTLASWGPNAPITVSKYDEFDRLEKMMVADRTTTSTWDFANATSVSGDYVLEQTEYRYEADSGLLDLVTNRMALHDNATTGSLTGSNAVTTYMGYIYDSAHRGIATVSFGTNKTGSNAFSATAGTVPTLTDYDTLDELRLAGDLLYSWRVYNSRGLVEDVIGIQVHGDDSPTSAADLINRYLYDDLYRSIATIENADAISSLSWDSTDERYTVSGFDHTKQDTDRVTSFAYDGVSNIVKRVAHLAEDNGSGGTQEGVQVTEYVYGVTEGSTANIMDSLVHSNNLLAEVRYPDESDGEAGGADYTVKYAYNRLGELRGVTDQNGTIRNLVRDQRGRVTRDIASTVGSGVDSTIRMLEYGFDANGRLIETTSYTDSGAITVRDQVELAYTPLWQIETVSQQHDGVVTTSSPQVKYRYDDSAISGGSGNYSRLSKMVYPTDNTGSTLDETVVYGYDSGIDDRISRVSSISVDGLPGANDVLIDYERIGLGLTAVALMPNAGGGIQLDRTVNHDGSRANDANPTDPVGAYPAFDKYGRIVRHMWVRDDYSTGTGGLPNQPAVVEVTHEYDRMSNRLSYQDEREGAGFEDRNRAFAYDGLNRLIKETRLDTDGTTSPLPPSSTYTSQHYSQEWDLDMLGNWSSLTADADEDGDLTDAQGNGNLDTRGANHANEYEGELHAQYDRKVNLSAGSRYYDYAHDKNGNLTEERSGTSLPIPPTKMTGLIHTYDAWNRLVKSEFEPSSGPNTTISENTYNALGWRTSKKFDTATGAYDGLDQERLFLYDASWRIVEEHIDTDNNSSIDWISQEFWGVRYIDDSVAKRLDRDADGVWDDAECSVWYRATDSQFSVVAMIDEGGDMYERIEYDAYGNARHRYYGDVNGDGIYDVNDLITANGTTNINSTNYHADIDTDFDGTYQSDEVNAYSSGPSTALPDGWISDPTSTVGPDNSIGYAGYVHNPEREDYSVRFRVYSPELGRWMQRDPAGYVDGMSLYRYGMSNPLMYTDPMGLQVSVKCVRCTKPSGDFKMTCCINDSKDPSYSKCTEANDYGTCQTAPQPRIGNQPSETEGDPYGYYGPLEPGDYSITNHPMGRRRGRVPVVTNHPTQPNHITTTRGTRRDGIMFHDQYRYSNGCITAVDHSFDNELKKKINENGGRIPFKLVDAGDCPEEDDSCGTGEEEGNDT